MNVAGRKRASPEQYLGTRVADQTRHRYSVGLAQAPIACARNGSARLISGNRGSYDTIWRVISGLNRIVLPAGSEGVLRSDRERRHVLIVEGIVGAESPYHPRL